MLYEIVLLDGTVLKCWTEDYEGIIEMMFKDSIFIVQENEHPNMVTYIMPERVSHYRFPCDDINVAEPR